MVLRSLRVAILFAVLLTLSVGAAAAAGRKSGHVMNAGSEGTGEGQFDRIQVFRPVIYAEVAAITGAVGR